MKCLSVLLITLVGIIFPLQANSSTGFNKIIFPSIQAFFEIEDNTNILYYATYTGENYQLIKYDLNTNKELSTIEISGSHTGISTLTLNPKLELALLTDIGNLIIVNTSTNTIQNKIPLSFQTTLDTMLTIDPEKTRAWIIDKNSKLLIKVEDITMTTTANSNVKNIELENKPLNILYYKNKIYLLQENQSTILVLDSDTLEKISEIEINQIPINFKINQDTGRLFILNSDGKIAILDLDKNIIENTLNISLPSYYFEINPSTNQLYLIDTNGFLTINSADNGLLTNIIIAPGNNFKANLKTNKIYSKGIYKDLITAMTINEIDLNQLTKNSPSYKLQFKEETKKMIQTASKLASSFKQFQEISKKTLSVASQLKNITTLPEEKCSETFSNQYSNLENLYSKIDNKLCRNIGEAETIKCFKNKFIPPLLDIQESIQILITIHLLDLDKDGILDVCQK